MTLLFIIEHNPGILRIFFEFIHPGRYRSRTIPGGNKDFIRDVITLNTTTQKLEFS